MLEAALEALVKAGQPVVSIHVAKRKLIGQEFFRWEIATAVAGAVIGINPFDQPDVEDAKIALSAEEHAAIIEALSQGRPELAQQAMATHIVQAAQRAGVHFPTGL